MSLKLQCKSWCLTLGRKQARTDDSHNSKLSFAEAKLNTWSIKCEAKRCEFIYFYFSMQTSCFTCKSTMTPRWVHLWVKNQLPNNFDVSVKRDSTCRLFWRECAPKVPKVNVHACCQNLFYVFSFQRCCWIVAINHWNWRILKSKSIKSNHSLLSQTHLGCVVFSNWTKPQCHMQATPFAWLRAGQLHSLRCQPWYVVCCTIATCAKTL